MAMTAPEHGPAGASIPPAGLSRRATLAWLFALVALAVAVRLVRIADDPIWFDEGATLGIARMGWATVFGAMAEAESSPPGFYALSKLWLGLWGEDIVAARLLSVLLGAATVPVVWIFARRHLGRREAWLAGLLVALAATHVRLSQDARCYALLSFVCALAMLPAASLVRPAAPGRPGIPAALALGGLMGALLWIHPPAVIIVMTLNAVVIVGAATTPDWRRAILLLGLADAVAVAAAAAPLLAMLRHVFGAPEFVDRWIDTPDLFETAVIYPRALVAPHLSVAGGLVALAYAGLLAAAAALWWSRRNPVLLAVAAMLAAGGIGLPLASQFQPVLIDRTALFLLLPLAVLVSAGAIALPRRAAWVAAVLVVAPQALGMALYHGIETRKERWDLVAGHLLQELRPGDVVVITQSAFLEVALTTEIRRRGGTRGGSMPPILVVPAAARLEQLAARQLMPGRTRAAAALCADLRQAPNVWLVLRDQPDLVEDDPGVSTRGEVRAAFRAAGAHVAGGFTTIGIDAERWTGFRCPPA